MSNNESDIQSKINSMSHSARGRIFLHELTLTIGKEVNLFELTANAPGSDPTDCVDKFHVEGGEKLPGLPNDARKAWYRLPNGTVLNVHFEIGYVKWENPVEGTVKVSFERINFNRRAIA